MKIGTVTKLSDKTFAVEVIRDWNDKVCNLLCGSGQELFSDVARALQAFGVSQDIATSEATKAVNLSAQCR